MTNFVIRIPADERKTIKVEEALAKPSLDVLQKSVGGLIELVPGWRTIKFDDKEIRQDAKPRNCVAFMNEEGKLRNMPLNKRATIIWGDGKIPFDTILGDVIVLVGDKRFLS